MEGFLRAAIIALSFIAGILIYRFFVSYFYQPNDNELVAQDDHDAEVIASARNVVLTNLIATYCDAWDLSPDDFKSEIEVLGFHAALVSCFCKNTIIRFYVDWTKRTVRIGYICNWGKTHIIKNKTIHYRRFSDLSYEAVYVKLIDLKINYANSFKTYIKGLKGDELQSTIEELKNSIQVVMEESSNEEEEKVD